ncbi:FAD NAD(P)-binding domain protein [Apiospora marii]|uniref:FAD NAD(P)-binding domain protein n=1 Tax=Apiospora marii TaxID=335849 RepID=A0ABR1RKA9_9PEZI
MTRSSKASTYWNPPAPKGSSRVEIRSGQSMTWKRELKESMFIYSSMDTKDFDVQIAHPGVTALITEPPPGAPHAVPRMLSMQHEPVKANKQ